MKKMDDAGKLFLQKKPLFFNYNINFDCIMRCRMCNLWKIKQSERTPIESMKKHFRMLREWIGPFEVNLNGGEPLLSDFFFEMIRYMVSLEIRPNISTNGFLMNQMVSKYILEAGVDSINISLDGPEEIHDFMRGRKGSFNNAIKAVENLTSFKKNISLHCQTVLSAKNIPFIKTFIEWLKKNTAFKGINFQALAQPFGEPTDKNWYLKSDLWPKDKTEINQAIDSIIEFKNNCSYINNSIKQLESFRGYFLNPKEFNYSKCYIGYVSYSIVPTGHIYCCPNKIPIGMVEMHPEEVWNSENSKSQRADYINCKVNCHLLINCAFEDRLQEGISY